MKDIKRSTWFWNLVLIIPVLSIIFISLDWFYVVQIFLNIFVAALFFDHREQIKTIASTHLWMFITPLFYLLIFIALIFVGIFFLYEKIKINIESFNEKLDKTN